MDKASLLKKYNPAEQRWSGLETEDMKLQGCSLLIPSDVWYEAGPYMLAPQRIHVGVDQFVNFGGGEPVRIVAHSTKCSPYSKETGDSKPIEANDADGTVMPMFMNIAGKVRYTQDDEKLFTLSMMNKQDAESLGIPVINNKLDWPDVRALELCPICASTACLDEEYWMMLHELRQFQMETMTFATRQISRLMCVSCFESLWPCMVRGGGMRQEQALTINPGFPVAGFPAPKGIQTVTVNYRTWENSGMYSAADLKFRQQSLGALNSTLPPGGKIAEVGSLHDKKDPRIQDDEEACLYCHTIQEGGNHTCSQCKFAKYCSRECQRDDWKRHRLHCHNSKQREICYFR